MTTTSLLPEIGIELRESYADVGDLLLCDPGLPEEVVHLRDWHFFRHFLQAP